MIKKFFSEKNRKSFWSLLAGAAVLASILIYHPSFLPEALGSHFGGPASWDTGCGGTASISKSASGSGTSPNGQISVNVSTSNACTGVYWAVQLDAHAGPNTQYSNWLYGWGTGWNQTFTFSNLSAGDYTVSGDANLYWWNGSSYQYWLALSTTNGSVTISNPPPPPPPPPPPAPNTPSLSGPTQVYYGNTANYSWSAASGATYYLFGYQYKDAAGNTISSISNTTMQYVGNTTSKSLTVTTDTSAKTLYGILVACNDGGCGGFSNSVGANLLATPVASDFTADLTANDTNGITIPYNSSATIKWSCSTTDANASLISIVMYPCPATTFPSAPNDCNNLAANTKFNPGTFSSGNLTSSQHYELTCNYQGGDGNSFQAVDNVDVTVQAPTLDVSMSHSASPSTHTLSSGQVLTTSSVVVGGTATGNIGYSFDCNNGSAVQTANTTNTSQNFSCTYTSAGTYNPSVTVTRAGLSASTNEFVTIYNPITVDLKVNGGDYPSSAPLQILTYQTANLTWTSSNASSCASSGNDWGNYGKSLNNSTGETIGPLPQKTYTYTLTCSNSGGASASDSVVVDVKPPATLLLNSCSPNPSSGTTNDTINWTANWKGGVTPYTYQWSFGSGTNSTSQTSATGGVSYASTGTKTENITITSADGQTISNWSCDPVTISYPPITGSCSANITSANTGDNVTWSAGSIAGGTGSYTYEWSGTDSLACPGQPKKACNTIIKSYSTSGTKYASLKVYSGSTNSQFLCSNSVSVTYTNPTTSLSADPTSIAYGASATLSWSSSNSTSCSISPTVGSITVNKSSSTSVSPTANTTYVLTCTNTAGVSSQSSATVNVSPIPTVTISTSPASIIQGENSTLTWSSSNTSSCSIDQGIGSVGTSGSQTISPSSSKTYTITCSNSANYQVSQSTTLNVTAQSLSVSLSVSPTSGRAALSSTLTATVSGTAPSGTTINYTFYCDRSDNATNIKSGYDAKFDGQTATTESTTCNYGSQGNYTAKVIVERGVASAAQAQQAIAVDYPGLAATCSVSPSSTTTGNNVTWKVDSATGGTGSYSYSWSGTDGLSGSSSSVAKSYNSTGTKTATVTVTSGNQSTTCTPSSITVSPKPTASLTPSPTPIIQGQSSTLTWSCVNSTSSSGSGFSTGGATSGSTSVSPNSTTSYTLTCTNSLGESGTDTKSVTVTPQSISISSFTANPVSGRATLSSTLTAVANTVLPPGTTLNFSIWWDCNNNTTNVSTAIGVCGSLPAPVAGTCQTNATGAKCDQMSNNSQSVSNSYASQGSYTPKVIIEGGVANPQEARTSVTVDYPLLQGVAPTTKISTANTPVSFAVTGGTGSYNWTTPANCVPLSGSGATFTLSCDKTGSYTITTTSGTQSTTFTLIITSTILSFKATPTVVNPGQSTTLTWSTTGFNTCSIDQGIGSVATDSGSSPKTVFIKQNSDNSLTQVTYTLTCTDAGGATQSSSQTVTVSKIPNLQEIVPK